MHFSFTIFIHNQAISIDSALWRASNHAHRLKRLASCIHTLKHTLAHREGAYPHFYTHTEGAYQASFRHTQHAAGGSRKRKPCPDEYRGAASADLVRVDKIDPAVDDCSRAFEGITVPDWH